MLRTIFALSLVVLAAFAAPSFAQQPEGEIQQTPEGMTISGSLVLSDPRWELDAPTTTYRWSSESLGIVIQTSCEFRLRRSTEDAYAVILWGCEGLELDAVVFIFPDLGKSLWGVYDLENKSVIGAIRAANEHFASPSEIDPAGKLTVWDGTFETGSADVRSWGQVKDSLGP